MYSDVFCRVYNELGWNYYPEAFGEQLLEWINRMGLKPESSMDLGCGTGILCRILAEQGIDASGTDLSEGMIRVARENYPHLKFDVADMTTYLPERSFDLVTCTGDALNHIGSMEDVERIFRNVYDYLNPGGYFLFDILNEREVSTSEPFELDFDESTRVWFQMTRPGIREVNLNIRVFLNGVPDLEENIREYIHDPMEICRLLERCGFRVVKCADSLLDDPDCHGTTWFVIAAK